MLGRRVVGLSIPLANVVVLALLALSGRGSPHLASRDLDYQSYDGFSVYRVEPKDEEQLADLQRLMDDESLKIVYWREPVAVGEFVDILAGPEAKEALMLRLNDSSVDLAEIVEDIGLKLNATIEDAADKADKQDDDDDGGQVRSTFGSSGDSLRQSSHNSFTSRYLSYAAIIARIESLIAADPSRASLEVIGQSYEGRDLYVVKITGGRPGKPVVFLDAGHHAREWISPAVALYTIESLLLQSPSEGSLGSSLRDFDFWIVPLVNPDGYEYSRTRNRLWRKTRSRPPRRTHCRTIEESYGVDPNRNYPAYWGQRGSSRSPCSEIYAGPAALSEPETKALARLLSLNGPSRIAMYLSLHSYAQLVLAPFGHMDVRPDNWSEHERVAWSFIDSVRRASGTRYGFGTAAGLMGPASGGSDDYAKLKAHIRIAFTIELPDRDVRVGFLMPARRIKPIGHETTMGLRSMCATLAQILAAG